VGGNPEREGETEGRGGRAMVGEKEEVGPMLGPLGRRGGTVGGRGRPGGRGFDTTGKRCEWKRSLKPPPRRGKGEKKKKRGPKKWHTGKETAGLSKNSPAKSRLSQHYNTPLEKNKHQKTKGENIEEGNLKTHVKKAKRT